MNLQQIIDALRSLHIDDIKRLEDAIDAEWLRRLRADRRGTVAEQAERRRWIEQMDRVHQQHYQKMVKQEAVTRGDIQQAQPMPAAPIDHRTPQERVREKTRAIHNVKV